MGNRLRATVVALAAAVLAACSAGPGTRPVESAASSAFPVNSGDVIEVAPFASKKAGSQLPVHWIPFVVPFKRHTSYRLVDTTQGVALEAQAQGTASGLQRRVSIDPARHSHMAWRWKVEQAIPQANKRDAAREDSPARLIVAFDGDRMKIDPAERAMMNLFEALAGQPVPYATLMYVYSNREPPGTVLPSPRTTRIRMIVVEQGGEGRWSDFRRDVAADYRLAFGEEPGPIIAVGVMTDADNTQGSARAQYGDIRFIASAK